MHKILYVNWGGLGDHLAFSTLPEAFNSIGVDFYVSDKSIFRDKMHYDLIWGCNPYVKGISIEQANCGHVDNWGLDSSIRVEFDNNLSMHRNIEKLYGVCSNIDYPKIYYKPNNLIQYKDYILVDLNASSVANYKHDTAKVLTYLSELKNEKVLYVLSDSSYGTSIVDIKTLEEYGFESIKTRDIFHYTDLIFSCKKIICFWSGGCHLATSIKYQHKPSLEIDCFKVDTGMPGWGTVNKSFFWYDSINYISC